MEGQNLKTNGNVDNKENENETVPAYSDVVKVDINNTDIPSDNTINTKESEIVQTKKSVNNVGERTNNVELVVKPKDVQESRNNNSARSNDLISDAETLTTFACLTIIFCNIICGIAACNAANASKEFARNDPGKAQELIDRAKKYIGLSVLFGIIGWGYIIYSILHQPSCSGYYC
mmetsp:Transcript_102263/g.125081  ORF Transcript_102263/g.125081 Transcript_102263/m.125081 type:complete len:176 (+) Transcript_102263:34-561(+)